MVFEEEKDDFAEVMDKQTWLRCVESGFFIPDDGCGYWGTATHYSYDYECFSQPPAEATHVHWFNR